MGSNSALTRARCRTRRVPGSAKRRFVNRGHEMPDGGVACPARGEASHGGARNGRELGTVPRQRGRNERLFSSSFLLFCSAAASAWTLSSLCFQLAQLGTQRCNLLRGERACHTRHIAHAARTACTHMCCEARACFLLAFSFKGLVAVQLLY